MTIFGDIPPSNAVAGAVETVLRRWLVVYLAEVERQQGLDPQAIATPKSYETFADDDVVETWPEQQIPAIVVMAPGLAEPPVRDGEGLYRTRWAVVVGAVVASKDKADVRYLAELYAAAIRACLVQHRTLEGAALAVDWVDESNDVLSSNASRTLAACRVVFEIEIENTVQDGAGPVGDPPEDPYTPYDEWPDASSTDVTVDPVTET